jgi:hypothetical protein
MIEVRKPFPVARRPFPVHDQISSGDWSAYEEGVHGDPYDDARPGGCGRSHQHCHATDRGGPRWAVLEEGARSSTASSQSGRARSTSTKTMCRSNRPINPALVDVRMAPGRHRAVAVFHVMALSLLQSRSSHVLRPERLLEPRAREKSVLTVLIRGAALPTAEPQTRARCANRAPRDRR